MARAGAPEGLTFTVPSPLPWHIRSRESVENNNLKLYFSLSTGAKARLVRTTYLENDMLRAFWRSVSLVAICACIGASPSVVHAQSAEAFALEFDRSWYLGPINAAEAYKRGL